MLLRSEFPSYLEGEVRKSDQNNRQSSTLSTVTSLNCDEAAELQVTDTINIQINPENVCPPALAEEHGKENKQTPNSFFPRAENRTLNEIHHAQSTCVNLFSPNLLRYVVV